MGDQCETSMVPNGKWNNWNQIRNWTHLGYWHGSIQFNLAHHSAGPNRAFISLFSSLSLYLGIQDYQCVPKSYNQKVISSAKTGWQTKPEWVCKISTMLSICRTTLVPRPLGHYLLVRTTRRNTLRFVRQQAVPHGAVQQTLPTVLLMGLVLIMADLKYSALLKLTTWF